MISLIFSPSFSLFSRTPATFLLANQPPRCNVFGCTFYHEVCHWIQRKRRNLRSSFIFQESEKCKFCLSFILIFMFLHLLCRRRILCFVRPPLHLSYFCTPSSSYLLRFHPFLFLFYPLHLSCSAALSFSVFSLSSASSTVLICLHYFHFLLPNFQAIINYWFRN